MPRHSRRHGVQDPVAQLVPTTWRDRPRPVEVHVMTAHRSFGGRLVRRRSAILILLALVGSVSSAGPVVAANGTTIVRGVQSAYGTCRDVEGVLGYQMTGSLEGCWVIDTFVSATDPNRSTFRATGTEHFEGCLGSVCGTFQTTYSYTAKTDGPWPASARSPWPLPPSGRRRCRRLRRGSWRDQLPRRRRRVAAVLPVHR